MKSEIIGAICKNVSLYFLGSHQKRSSLKPSGLTFRLNFHDVLVEVNSKEAFGEISITYKQLCSYNIILYQFDK